MGKQEDANLILRLYEIRREPVMREARNWFFTFNPTSAAEYMEAIMGEHSGHLRMVITYWDMAASLVNNGAIDEQMFNDANGCANSGTNRRCSSISRRSSAASRTTKKSWRPCASESR